MEHKPECQDLAARFEQKAAQGLLDVKFLLQNRDEAGEDEVCLEAKSLYCAMDENKGEPLNFGDFRWR